MNRKKLIYLCMMLFFSLLAFNSCGLLLPFTMEFIFENKYIVNNEQKELSITVNKQTSTERKLKYGEFERYNINWWREDVKTMFFDLQVVKINGVSVTVPVSEEVVDNITNFQTVTITFIENGQVTSPVGVSYNVTYKR